MTDAPKPPTKAQIRRAIAAARDEGAAAVRLPGGIVIDLNPQIDETAPRGFRYDHEQCDGEAA